MLSEAGKLIEVIAKALVDKPEAVVIIVHHEPTYTTIRLTVAPNDVGKVIGKAGRTARSIRTILSGFSSARGHRHVLDIVEGGKKETHDR